MKLEACLILWATCCLELFTALALLIRWNFDRCLILWNFIVCSFFLDEVGGLLDSLELRSAVLELDRFF
ncbi:hypothetical protein Dimus_036651, partial [Dionaea muscipula]